MNRLLKRLVLCGVIGLAIAGGIIGPGRLYGILCSQEVEGRIEKILPYGKSESSTIELYLVEVHADPNVVYLTPSSDPQWVMVSMGERVRMKLYPSPPWTIGTGPWQNALLVSKLADSSRTATQPPVPQEAVATSGIESKETSPAPAAVQ